MNYSLFIAHVNFFLRVILKKNVEEFPARLRSLVGDASVSSFARQCGLSESVIRSYLAGGKLPGLRHLLSIAEAKGVSIDWLAVGARNRNSAPSSSDSHHIQNTYAVSQMPYAATYSENRNGSDSSDSKVPILENETELLNGTTADLADLVTIYKDAPPEGRRALVALAVAIRDRTLRAWLAAGQAIAETAQLFDRTK